MKFLTWLKGYLLYADVEGATSPEVIRAINESNRRNLHMFSGIAAIGMLILFCLSFFNDQFAQSRTAYVVVIILNLAISVASRNIFEGHITLVAVLCYIFAEVLFGFGIAMGTIVEPNQASLSFIVLMFVIPLLFMDRPICVIGFNIVNMVIYFVLAHATQSPEIFSFNASCILPYGVAAFFVIAIMMKAKVSRVVLEHKNQMLSESDQLTGMLNRRSYEQRVASIRQQGCSPDLKVCALDVNGLKVVNDKLGHQAGDELICGAAECIKNVFGPYGLCYRVGGDEFVAILEGPTPDDDEFRERLDAACKSYRGELVSELSISLGIRCAEEGVTIDELLHWADQAMYSFKAQFYKNNAVYDRRSR